MRIFLSSIFFLYSALCFSQAKHIYGIYFCKFSYLGKVTCILKLDSNNTFNYYENVDEGDVTSECLSSGKFYIERDSIFFESLYDSSYNTGNLKNIFFVNFPASKFKVSNSGIQIFHLPRIAGERNTELQLFSKFDFSKLDSIKATAFTSEIEDILITQAGFVKLSSSKFNGKRIFNIDEHKYKRFLVSLSQLNYFSLVPKKDKLKSIHFGCIELFIGGDHFSVCGNYFSQELYNLLFKNYLAE